MSTIGQLSAQRKLQIEEEYRNKFKRKQFNVGGFLVTTALAAAIFPATKGVVKNIDLLIGNTILNRKSDLLTRIAKKTIDVETGESVFDSLSNRERKILEGGLDKVRGTADAAVFNRVAKQTFGTVNESIGKNVLTATTGTDPNATLSQIAMRSFLKLPNKRTQLVSGGAPWQDKMVKAMTSPAYKHVEEMLSHSIAANLAYTISGALTGQKGEESTGFLPAIFQPYGLAMAGWRYAFKHGIPKITTRILGEQALSNTKRFIDNVPENLAASFTAIRQSFDPGFASASFGEKLGLFSQNFKRLRAQYQKASKEYSAFGLMELERISDFGFGPTKRLTSNQLTQESDLMAKAVDSLSRRMTEEMYDPPAWVKNSANYEKLKVSDLIKNTEIRKEMRGFEPQIEKAEGMIRRFSKLGRTDIAKKIADMEVGPGTFKNLTPGDTKVAFFKDQFHAFKSWNDLLTKYMQVPGLGFNPMSLLRADLSSAFVYRNTMNTFSRTDVVSTLRGPKRVQDLVAQAEVKGMKFAQGVSVGNRFYMYRGDTHRNVDITNLVGEFDYINRSEISGGIGRTLAMQLGIIRKDQPYGGKLKRFWRRHDLPFNNQFNFQENDLEQARRTFGNLIGTSNLNKGIRKLKTGKPLDDKEMLSILQMSKIVTSKFMHGQVLDSVADATDKEVQGLAADFFERLLSSNKALRAYTKNLNQAMKKLKGPDRENAKTLHKLLIGIQNRLGFDTQGKYSTIASYLHNNKGIDEIFLTKTIGRTGEETTFREIIQQMAVSESLISDNNMARQIKNRLTGLKLTPDAEMAFSAQRGYANVVKALSEGLPGDVDTAIGYLRKNLSENIGDMGEFLSKASRWQKFLFMRELNEPLKSFKTSTSNVAYGITGSTNVFQHAQYTDQKNILGRLLFPTRDKGAPSTMGVLAHWVIDRPIALMEEIGLGRPDPSKTRNALQSLGQVMFKRVLPVWAVVEGAKAVNAMVALNGAETTPFQAANQIAGKAAVGAAKLSESIGLTWAMDQMQENFPGLVPAVGAGVSSALGLEGEEMLAFTSAFSFLENIPYTAKLRREIEGEKNVAIRSGRWWEFGRTPYMGGKTVDWRPHQLYLGTTGWEFSEEKYGSPLEYLTYKNMFPTPFNLFGLNTVMPGMQQYYYENKQYASRPYPKTGLANFTNIPMLGQLAQPLSYIIKPPFQMHDDELQQEANRMVQEAVRQAQTSVSTGRQIAAESAQLRDLFYPLEGLQGGMSKIRTGESGVFSSDYREMYDALAERQSNIVENWGIKEALNTSSKFFADYTGMIGFMTESFVGNPPFLGNPAASEPTFQKQLATATLMDNANISYYQRSLGSMFGYSELYRRFNQNLYSRYENYYNPIPNTMPYWMPGSDYFVNFKQGDPYSKIAFGETRLPGEAYGMTHKLFDNYGPIDKGRILLNVAPWSTQAKVYESVFKKYLAKADSFDVDERYAMTSAITEAQQQRERYDFSNYPYSTPYVDEKIELGEYLGQGSFSIRNQKVNLQLEGLETDIDKAAKAIYEKEDISLEHAYAKADTQLKQLETYMQSLAGESIALTRPKDFDVAYQFKGNEVKLTGFNQQLIDYAREIGGSLLNTETDIGKRAVRGTGALKQIWEFASHRWGFFQEKFWQNNSAKEEYERYVVYGTKTADWKSFLSDFVGPGMANIANLNPAEALAHGGVVGGMYGSEPGSKLVFGGIGAVIGGVWSAITPASYVPSETRERWEMEEQYDFAKAARMRIAKQSGRPSPRELPMAGMYQSGTLTGMERRLPRIEREFLSEFVNLPSDEIERLLKHTPAYMKEMVEYGREVKRAKIAGEALPTFENDYTDRFEDYYANLPEDVTEDPFLNVDFDLDAMYALEGFNRFSNYSKLFIYDEDIYQAMLSLLESPIPQIDPTNLFYMLEQQAAMEMMRSINSRRQLSLNTTASGARSLW